MTNRASVTDQWGLPQDAIEKIRHIFREYSEIESVVIYGSRAKGNTRKGSDIDLCMEGSEIELSTQLAIENKIDDLLLPWKVDLSIKHKIENPDLLEHIDRIGKVFYKRDA